VGQPAARLTDMTACPMVTPGTPPVPHVGGPIVGPCSPNVIVGGMPQATVSDMAQCVGPPATIIKGSATVLVNGKPAARMGDMTNHGGTVVSGFPTVLIGDASSAGGGAGASGDFSGANASDFAKSLKQASDSGKAFCEVCYQQAQKRAELV
jgi:uncharacterized Zn-binding protein involved in type VI secretion